VQEKRFNVADRVLLSAGIHNFHSTLDIALQYGLGLELMAFGFPQTLDGDWRGVVREYKPLLRALKGELSLHGPFIDMTSGSPDQRIIALTIERYKHAINIATELEASAVVLHANFIAMMRNQSYRDSWHKNNVAFWGPMADYAKQHGIIIVMENMWEYDPHIIADIVRDVNHSHLRVCLDVGHAFLFGDAEWKFDDWLRIFQPWLVHAHINNNDGKVDVHHGLNRGVIDYHIVLEKLRALPNPPELVLEIDDVAEMVESLPFLKLKAQSGHLRD
jgi:sugar phosphate isomerase/epimerase